VRRIKLVFIRGNQPARSSGVSSGVSWFRISTR
jgi:hypothetical protein